MAELIDPQHTRRDLRQLESAIRKGWQIPDAIYQQAASILGTILAKGSDRDKIAATRVLVAMHNSNAAPSMPAVHSHNHLHVSAKDLDIEERRRLLIEKANRLGVS